MRFRHVDVFADRPLTGNGLVVFLAERFPDPALMLALTGEMRQFESVFLAPHNEGGTAARIFTTQEELGFAGHPLLGAAAVLHESEAPAAERFAVVLHVGERRVNLLSMRTDAGFTVEMDQGAASVDLEPDPARVAAVAEALGLRAEDLDRSMPAAVASTGLPYLVLPVRADALRRARVVAADLEVRLAHVGAKFVYVLDAAAIEGRTWENDGSLEDAATGSAAGPVAALLAAVGRLPAGETLTIAQGHFIGRPSRMRARVDRAGRVHVAGEVAMVARGELDARVF